MAKKAPAERRISDRPNAGARKLFKKESSAAQSISRTRLIRHGHNPMLLQPKVEMEDIIV